MSMRVAQALWRHAAEHRALAAGRCTVEASSAHLACAESFRLAGETTARGRSPSREEMVLTDALHVEAHRLAE